MTVASGLAGVRTAVAVVAGCGSTPVAEGVDVAHAAVSGSEGWCHDIYVIVTSHHRLYAVFASQLNVCSITVISSSAE